MVILEENVCRISSKKFLAGKTDKPFNFIWSIGLQNVDECDAT
jgi:hypothetical protein